MTACSPENITPNVTFLEHSFWGNCMQISRDDTTIVIRSADEYEEFFEARRNTFNDCSKAQPPHIDFEKHTLIGTLTESSGCSREYDRVVIQKGNQKVTYTVRVYESGGCKPLALDMNWAMIPKIKKRTDVLFDAVVVR